MKKLIGGLAILFLSSCASNIVPAHVVVLPPTAPDSTWKPGHTARILFVSSPGQFLKVCAEWGDPGDHTQSCGEVSESLPTGFTLKNSTPLLPPAHAKSNSKYVYFRVRNDGVSHSMQCNDVHYNQPVSCQSIQERNLGNN